MNIFKNYDLENNLNNETKHFCKEKKVNIQILFKIQCL